MLWLKALHIVFVLSWMAGLLYLPRLFVNLAQDPHPAVQTRLLLMARKLLRFTTLLGQIAVALGVWLWLAYHFQGGWLHAKLVGVAGLIAFNVWCARLLRQFEAGQNRHSHVWYRWFNEIPTLLMLAIVLLVVFKPF